MCSVWQRAAEQLDQATEGSQRFLIMSLLVALRINTMHLTIKTKKLPKLPFFRFGLSTSSNRLHISCLVGGDAAPYIQFWLYFTNCAFKADTYILKSLRPISHIKAMNCHQIHLYWYRLYRQRLRRCWPSQSVFRDPGTLHSQWVWTRPVPLRCVALSS